jgi:hypothetical protein
MILTQCGNRILASNCQFATYRFTAIKRYDNKPVEDFAAATIKKPPVLDKDGEGESPMGWLRCFERRKCSSHRLIKVDVAGEVGYESEAAFNRAFKRTFGTPPARYRREGNAARRG